MTANNTPPAKDVNSVRDIARRAGISHVLLYDEINAGRLRTLKIGRRRLITEKAFLEWLAERERAAQ